MVKPPATVKVGPYVVTIATEPLIDSDVWGVYFPTRQHIAVTEDMTPGHERETLMHELDHACAFAAGFRGSGGKFSEEEWITRLAPVRTALLLENPQLVRYLQGGNMAAKKAFGAPAKQKTPSKKGAISKRKPPKKNSRGVKQA